MAAIQLPITTTHIDLIAGLRDAGVLANDDWSRLAVHVPENFFISTAAIAFLGAWGKRQVQGGKTIEFFGSRSDLNYLSRLDLFQHLNFENYEERFERHPEAGRFAPILLIEDEDSVMSANNAICDLVLSQFDNAREFLPAMEWSVYEIVDNIRSTRKHPRQGSSLPSITRSGIGSTSPSVTPDAASTNRLANRRSFGATGTLSRKRFSEV